LDASSVYILFISLVPFLLCALAQTKHREIQMKKIVMALMMLASTSALADMACVQRASNEELVNEMAYRLIGQGNLQSQGEIRLGLTCDSWGTLTAVATDLSTGKSEIKKLDAGSACSTLVTKMNAKKTKRGGLAAACDSWGTLSKLVIIGTTVTLEKSDIGSGCSTIADSLSK
jgi:hypothetical protein